jgi:hypothetical protein
MAQPNAEADTNEYSGRPSVPYQTFQSTYRRSAPIPREQQKPYPCAQCNELKKQDAMGWYCPCVAGEIECDACGDVMRGGKFTTCRPCYRKTRPQREPREPRESREYREPREPRESREYREPREPRESRRPYNPKPYPCDHCNQLKKRDPMGWYCPCVAGESECVDCKSVMRGGDYDRCRPCYQKYREENPRRGWTNPNYRENDGDGGGGDGYRPRRPRGPRLCETCENPLHPDRYCAQCDKDRLRNCDYDKECERLTKNGTSSKGHYCWKHWPEVRDYLA